MVEENIPMTPEVALINEATDALRRAKDRSGMAIEREVALRKLGEIANPNKEQREPERPTDGNLEARLYLFRGIVEDYGEVLAEKPGLKDSLHTLEERTRKQVTLDYMETVAGYNHLSFPDDPTVVASTETERQMIEDAARLLGYSVSERDGKKVYEPAPRYKTPGNLEEVIRTRIRVGIDNLIEDYTSVEGIRRPVLRTVVAMADGMAKTLRTPAK